MLAFDGVDRIKLKCLHADANEFYRTYAHRNMPVSCLSFSSDGKLLAVVAVPRNQQKTDKPTCIFDLESEEMTPKYELSLCIRTAIFDNTGNKLLCGTGSEVFVFDLGLQEKTISVCLDDGGMMYPPMVFSSDFKMIIASFTAEHLMSDGNGVFGLKLWDAETGIELHTVMAHTEVIRAISVSSFGDIFASCSNDGTIIVYDATDFTQKCVVKRDNDTGDIGTDDSTGIMMTTVSFVPFSRKLVCADLTSIMLWEYEQQEHDFRFSLLYSIPICAPPHRVEWISPVSVSADGSCFACTFDNACRVKVFDMLSGEVQYECESRSQSVCCFSRESMILL